MGRLVAGRTERINTLESFRLIYFGMCSHLLPFVLRQVGLQLEVGFELAGAELALVGAVDHHHLVAVSLALLLLDGLRWDVGVLALHGLPLRVGSRGAVLTLPRDVCKAPAS